MKRVGGGGVGATPVAGHAPAVPATRKARPTLPGLSDTYPRHHTGPVLHHMRARTTATHHAPGTCAAHTTHRHRHHRHTAASGSSGHRSSIRHTSPTQP